LVDLGIVQRSGASVRGAGYHLKTSGISVVLSFGTSGSGTDTPYFQLPWQLVNFVATKFEFVMTNFFLHANCPMRRSRTRLVRSDGRQRTQVDTAGVLRALLALRTECDPLLKVGRGLFASAEN
jgi:hypothetical protein